MVSSRLANSRVGNDKESVCVRISGLLMRHEPLASMQDARIVLNALSALEPSAGTGFRYTGVTCVVIMGT